MSEVSLLEKDRVMRDHYPVLPLHLKQWVITKVFREFSNASVTRDALFEAGFEAERAAQMAEDPDMPQKLVDLVMTFADDQMMIDADSTYPKQHSYEKVLERVWKILVEIMWEAMDIYRRERFHYNRDTVFWDPDIQQWIYERRVTERVQLGNAHMNNEKEVTKWVEDRIGDDIYDVDIPSARVIDVKCIEGCWIATAMVYIGGGSFNKKSCELAKSYSSLEDIRVDAQRAFAAFDSVVNVTTKIDFS